MKKNISNLYPYFQITGSQKFHQETKISELRKTTPNDKTKWPKEWVDINYKGYPRFPKIPLPASVPIKTQLSDALKKRRSYREFVNKPITIKELSTILYQAGGIKELQDNDSKPNRFYPSAGARYPLEIYPIVLNVKGLKKGLYHYHLRTHSLEHMWTFDNFANKILANFNQEWINKASVIFVVSAVFWRMEVKYGERGYRNTLMEAGMLTQNLYLVINSLKLACSSIGGFIDDGLHNLLDLDGKEEAIVTVLAVGKK